jgi:hypothetical protein
MRVTFNNKKVCIVLELIACTPAYYYRKGSSERMALVKGKPVELYNQDRFTMIHDLHLVQIEISAHSLTACPRPICSTRDADSEKMGLLNNMNETRGSISDTPTAF